MTINQVERDILKMADQITKKNKILNIETLHRTAKLRLGLSDENISKNIYSLIIKKLINNIQYIRK